MSKKLIILTLFLLLSTLAIVANPQILWLNFGPKPKVVIDPGHGGNDPGTIQGDLYEKDINLEMAKKLKKFLAYRGFNVILTREKDEALSLKYRTNFTNKENPDIFISIHANSNTNHSIKGMEVYWHTPQSKNFAEKIYQSLNDNLLASHNRGLLNSRFYVLRRTSIPSALVEIGYLSNYYDRYGLLDDNKKSLIVDSIGKGIVDYIKALQ